MFYGLFTPSERESDIANIWIVLFSIQLFIPSDAKDQRKNRFRFLRSLGVNGPLAIHLLMNYRRGNETANDLDTARCKTNKVYVNHFNMNLLTNSHVSIFI